MAKYKSHRVVQLKEGFTIRKYGNGKYPKLKKPLVYVFLALCALPIILMIISIL